MKISSQMMLSDIAMYYPAAVAVLENFRLDYCCGGRKSIADACSEKGLVFEEVQQQLQSALYQAADVAQKINPAEMDLDLLVDYICASHHAYVRRMLPLVQGRLTKLVQVHGQNHPELKDVAAIWEDLSVEMNLHMRKEEEILFPFVKSLAGRTNDNYEACFRSVRGPISVMEFEHERAGDAMKKIAALTSNYSTPADGCNTYRQCLRELEAFEHDLHRHVHLENNVMFPKVIQLENQINQIQ